MDNLADYIYLEEAKKLANMAAMAIEECQSYIDSIKNNRIRKEAEDYLDRKIELL